MIVHVHVIFLHSLLSHFLQIPLPELVTGRYYHTVSSFVLDPNHVFLIIVGGFVKTAERKYVGGGVMKWLFTPVTDPNNTMLIELGKSLT